VVDKLLFRFSTGRCVPETFAIKVDSCPKSRRVLDFLVFANLVGGLTLPYLTFGVDVTRTHTIQRQGHQVGPLRFPDKPEAKEIS